MSPAVAFGDLRLKLYNAHRALDDAQEALHRITDEMVDFLEENPPKTFRIQEAYLNADGSYSVPHWDEVADYKDQLLIDAEVVEDLLHQYQRWQFAFHNRTDDPRPAYRRIAEVSW